MNPGDGSAARPPSSALRRPTRHGPRYIRRVPSRTMAMARAQTSSQLLHAGKEPPASCRVDMPAEPARDIFPMQRPGGLPDQPYGQLRHSHAHMFVPRPTTSSPPPDDDYARMILASQHPQNCSAAKFLLVEDDMLRSGLGFTARMLASALLLAMREGRVLLEVPQRNGTTGRPFGRWCDRPPHTLGCVYLPWSHCSAASVQQAEATRSRSDAAIADHHELAATGSTAFSQPFVRRASWQPSSRPSTAWARYGSGLACTQPRSCAAHIVSCSDRVPGSRRYQTASWVQRL